MTDTSWLRPWRADDAQAVLDAHASSDDLERQTGPVPDLAAAEQVVAKYMDPVAAGTAHIWAIVDRDAVVGAVGVSNINRQHRIGWCWYWLAAPARGRGLATAALVAAAEHAFDDGLFRLELGHRLDNPASRAVAVAAGFQSEGIERAKLEYDGDRFDCETHARLATDPAPAAGGLEIRP